MSLDLDKTAWTRVTLGDVAASSKEKVDPSKGTVDRYIAGEHMDTDDLTIHRWGDPAEVDLGPAFHRRFRPGQVLYGSRRTYLRKVAVADFGGVCANTTFVVQTKDDQVLAQEFLPFVMSAEPFHTFAIAESKGSVNPYVNWSDIERYEFDLPPLDEQKRIADLLWAMERHRLSLSSLKSCLDGVSRAWRATVFDAPYKSRRLDERAIVTLGRQRAPQHATGKHMRDYVRSANISENHVSLVDVKQMNFTPQEQEKFRLQPGDVLVSEGTASPRELGSSAVWDPADADKEMYFQKTLIRLRPIHARSTAISLREWAKWARESGAFVRVSTGTGILHITAVRCSAMPFPVLSTEELARLDEFALSLSKAALSILSESKTLTSLRSSLLADIFGGN